MNGSLPVKTGSSSYRTSAQATLLELLGLAALGAIAFALHAAARRRFEIGPGHQGLTWMALVMIGRLSSRQRWAALAIATGAASVSVVPFWRFGDPFLWVAYATAGLIVDLGWAGFVRSRRALWAVALLGGAAHATKPLMRILLMQLGWRYESLLGGFTVPVASHFFYGALGAMLGMMALRIGQRS
jgi:hypothetical protein